MNRIFLLLALPLLAFSSPALTAQEAPNVLLVLTDDIGFAASSTFGGSIPTPNLDRLASKGLRYNRFHTTGVCSPTRASLLTGRNHHSVGSGFVPEAPSPYPGYTGIIPDSAASIARILRDNGFSTAMFGKEHNILNEHRSATGPFDHWPNARGFEHFFGFLGGDTNQWNPALFENTSPVNNRHRKENYLLDEQLADHTIQWLHHQQAAFPDKPFFIYLAPGSAHAPHHAHADWIARFRGSFDHGWDAEREKVLERQIALGLVPPNTALANRPATIPAWTELSKKHQKVFTRYMEVFAAMIAFQDAQIGRILDELERMGIADNTLVIFIEGDNGSSAEGGHEGKLNEPLALSFPDAASNVDIDWLAENLDILGGPDSYPAYPAGWAYATSTPFPWFKQIASHLGGVRNGMVMSWPQRIRKTGEIRNQYHHVIDVVPTILEATGVTPPEQVDGITQQAIHGTSMLYSIEDASVPSTRKTQYYEIVGNRGIYHDEWLAVTTPKNMPWEVANFRPDSDMNTYEWELYNLREDFSQSQNLAAQEPERLQTLQNLFDEQARKYGVYPIQDSGAIVRVINMLRHHAQPPKTEYHYWGPGIQLPLGIAPPIFSASFTVEAEVDIPSQNTDGVILAAGSLFGGWSFYLNNGKPTVYSSSSPRERDRVRLSVNKPLTTGTHTLQFEVQVEGEAAKTSITVDGKLMAQGEVLHRPLLMAGLGETLDIGLDTNVPVSPDYQDEGVFNGTIRQVKVKVKLVPSAKVTEGVRENKK